MPHSPILRLFLISIIGLAPIFAACGGCDDEEFEQARSGRILVSPNPIAFSQVPIGSSETLNVSVINLAEDDLTVFTAELRSVEGGSIEGLEIDGLPAGEFSLNALDLPPDLTPTEAPPELRVAEGAQLDFTVTYTPTEATPAARGELVFVSSDDRFTRDEPLVVPVEALGNRPRIDTQPRVVRFSRSAPGTRESQEVVIRNVGSAPLEIFEEPAYVGGEDFRVSLASRTYPLRLEIFDAEAASASPEDYELRAEVEYAPLGNGADAGELQIVSNDPSGQVREDDRTMTVVDIAASADSPCIQVDSTTRNLGQVPIGEATLDRVNVSNCGTQTLEITSIRLAENSDDDEFELDLGAFDVTGNGEVDSTIRLEPGEATDFVVRYIPVEEGIDRGLVVISNNDPLQSELEIDVTARGAEGICPVAHLGATIKGVSSMPRPSFSAAPLQYIVLDGSESSDEDGRVVRYNWEFLQIPDGVTPTFEPVDEDPGDQDQSKRQFRLLTAGTYEVELTVEDNDGFQSCGDPAIVTIRAVPNQKLLIELTWTNPEDPDETDDIGSDVDLHLAKMGPGAWFELPYDIFFRNQNNGPGSDNNGIWNPESPSLDIDDQNGAGPENIQMDDPANCEWYAVGVHYFSQSFGTAYATIRVYIDGNPSPAYEALNKPLTRGGQFWDVARIHWPSGQIYEYDNLLDVEPQQQAPDITPGMQSSGLCTNQGLYPVD